MSRFNANALKEVFVDGQSRYVPQSATLGDMVPSEVQSVSAINPATGKTELVTRQDFNSKPVPDAFFTNLSDFSKG